MALTRGNDEHNSMQPNHPYSSVVNHFASQPVVTLATGATCAFLGDERSLREHLITAEAARHLRAAGHTVIHFFIDDNLDPLNFRQLRVAVNKDPELIERFQGWCGRPIAYLPDPWGCCESYAAHFEEEFINRLHYVGCHPTLIRVAKLYERGLYRPAVRTVLENPGKIRAFLQDRFPEYIPEKLFWPICPHCHYIDATSIEGVNGDEVMVNCQRCQKSSADSLDSIPGKLNWKLDCAARWPLFHIDGEAFSQPYLEPHVGSYRIAQALSAEFFGGHEVFPLHYGLVKMETGLGGKLLDALPPKLLRDVFVESPATDIVLSRDSLVTAASRHQVQPDFTYLDFIKQVLPIWLLTPHALTWKQRELTKHAIAFGKEFLAIDAHPHLPQREAIEGAQAEVLCDLQALLQRVFEIRQSAETSATQANLSAADAALALQNEVKSSTNLIGANKKAVLQRFRAIVGQEHGLPVTKLLLLLPLEYLQ
ncbi:MAG TPA: hypothetical protein VF627_09470, partial [Abditibacterium sp.]